MSDTRKVVAFFNVDDEGFATPEEPLLLVAKLMRIFGGQRVQGTFMVPEDAMSTEQMGYYRGGVIGALVKEGWDEKDAHKWLKEECFTAEFTFREPGRRPEKITPSLAGLPMAPMAAYIDRCIRRLAMEGIYVPTPEEWLRAKGRMRA